MTNIIYSSYVYFGYYVSHYMAQYNFNASDFVRKVAQRSATLYNISPRRELIQWRLTAETYRCCLIFRPLLNILYEYQRVPNG